MASHMHTHPHRWGKSEKTRKQQQPGAVWPSCRRLYKQDVARTKVRRRAHTGELGQPCHASYGEAYGKERHAPATPPGAFSTRRWQRFTASKHFHHPPNAVLHARTWDARTVCRVWCRALMTMIRWRRLSSAQMSYQQLETVMKAAWSCLEDAASDICRNVFSFVCTFFWKLCYCLILIFSKEDLDWTIVIDSDVFGSKWKLKRNKNISKLKAEAFTGANMVVRLP